MSFRDILILAVCTTSASNAFAFRNADMTGDDAGAVAVYNFDETTGLVAHDSSGIAPAMDLMAKADGNLPSAEPIRTNALLQGGLLYMNPKPNANSDGPDMGYESAQTHRTFLISADASGNPMPASKLNSCTSGFTIQAFVRPYFPFQGNSSNLIVALSNSANATLDGANPTGAFSSFSYFPARTGSNVTPANAPNFGLYQTGQRGSEAAQVQVRLANGSIASQTSVTGAFSSVRQADNPGVFTELIASMDATGVMTVYVNRLPKNSTSTLSPSFLKTAALVVGNELLPLPDATYDPTSGMSTVNVTQQRNWSGEIAHMAIYCKSFSRSQIIGTIADNKSSAAVVQPAANAIPQSRIQARKMVERLTGGPIPIDHPMVAQVEARLLANDPVGAAKIVTGDKTLNLPGHPDFLNVVVKQMALKMSNREETIRTNLNDFAAGVIGVTRDETKATELLTGDFYYMADSTKANVRHDLFNDLLLSNNHYDDLETGHWDLGKVLKRVNGQQLATTRSGGVAANPDPAGILTSRAFMSAHAIAGTNRRLVEYAFREFECMPMSSMADTSASPARIGRDIDRVPGGDAMKFETSCKGCHTVMDGFRGAFAHWDFATMQLGSSTYNFVRNAQVNAVGTSTMPSETNLGFPNAVLTAGSSTDGSNATVDSNGVVVKMLHNESNFPAGYMITDDSFVNNAVGAANKPLFGWRGSQSRGGFGVNQFGQMIADSSRFSQCMAKRVYETVCKTGMKSDALINGVEQSLALRFEDSGYKLKTLFQEAAANPSCAAGQGR